MTKFTTRFNYKPPAGLVFQKPTRTQRHFAPDCDINNIMKKFTQTGVLPQASGQLEYGDFSEPFDLRDAMDTIIKSADNFAALPSKLRKRFHNDAFELLDFLRDPENHDEAVSLGLVEPRTSSLLDVTGTTDTKPQQKAGEDVASGTQKNAAAATSMTAE